MKKKSDTAVYRLIKINVSCEEIYRYSKLHNTKKTYYDFYFITVMSIVCQRRRRKQKGNHCHVMLLSS